MRARNLRVAVCAAMMAGAWSLLQTTSAQTEPQAPVRVGGSVQAPKKIKDVKPVYPEDARASGIQGVVILECIIETDGTVREAKVLRSVHPSLDMAATDAVMQWQYTPTLLNGVPVAVVMTTSVNFTLAGAAPAPQAPVRVGGDIKEPKKIKDVRPLYPEDAKAAGIQGIVILECVIATDGTVREAKVLRSVNPALDVAAADAVMQWEFTPTLLNGVPVELIMTVTVNFSLR